MARAGNTCASYTQFTAIPLIIEVPLIMATPSFGCSFNRGSPKRFSAEKDIQKVKEEPADVFIFMMYMCHEFGIDLLEEVEKKLILNDQKYPVEKAKGSSKKYSDF
jgi:hypothetical protein